MFKRLGVWMMVAALLPPIAANAQIVGDDVEPGSQASWNTLSPGTISNRAPGNMVAAGRADFNARHDDAIGRAIGGPTITQEPPESTLGDQVKSEVIDTLLDRFNAILVALEAAIGSGIIDPTDPGGGGGTPATGLIGLLGSISSPI